MGDITVLRARLRQRDKDIQQAVKGLELEQGQIADMIRNGFRKELAEIMPITLGEARCVVKELIRNIKEERLSK